MRCTVLVKTSRLEIQREIERHRAALVELEAELKMYRARSAERAQKWSGGLKRDIATDRAILNRIVDPNCERKQLAKDLGLTPAALASRLRRLRNEGHQIPNGRKRKRTKTAA